MKGFWNDDNGLSAMEFISVLLAIGAVAFYAKTGALDTQYADLVSTALLGLAGYQGVKRISERVSYQRVDAPTEKESGERGT